MSTYYFAARYSRHPEMSIDLEAIKARAKAATPEPWVWEILSTAYGSDGPRFQKKAQDEARRNARAALRAARGLS